MNKMVKMAAIAVGVAVMFAGCGGPTTPDAVAVDFLKTMQAGKATPEYIAKNCTAQTAQLFGMFGAMINAQAAEEMKGATFTVLETKINGDKAVVKIKQEGGLKPETKDMDLVLINGKWKINEGKEKSKDKQN